MKNITTYLILIWTLLATWACKPVKDGYGLDDPGQYSSVYIAAAFGGMQNITANTAEPLNIEIYANYSGVIALSEDLYVFMEADPDRVDEYNTENSKVTIKRTPNNANMLWEEILYQKKGNMVDIRAGIK